MDLATMQMAETLPVGSSRRGVCPVCKGGDSGEHSFVVGRESNRVWWKCFRAKCPHSGYTGAARLASPPATDAALARLRPYWGARLPLTAEDQMYFQARFELGVLAEVNPHIMRTEQDEYLLTVADSAGFHKGYVVRQPWWSGTPEAPAYGSRVEGTPKTKLYMHSMKAPLAWYRQQHGTGDRTLVLVEDQISALKVSRHCATAVALLGNGLNAEAVREITRWSPRRVIVALDPGAEGAAAAIVRKWGLYFDKIKAVLLDADPKDIPAANLAEELGL